ncbi:MAG: phosphonate ABC transporter, permease protein PhnE [Christensenellaceae bacterium]|jgi:phosphonate transport system permease protein|nr:phosphonate ABC transporter, permease protein PhnE [Christensenellaceae bacterium]
MSAYDKVFKPRRITLPSGKSILEKRSRMPLILLGVLALTALSVRITGFSFGPLLSRGNQFFVILRQMYPPNMKYLSSIWVPLFDTIKMSLLGSAVGSLLAVPFAVIAASNMIKSRLVLTLTRLFLSVVRTLPTLVTALIATYIFGLGTLAGTLSIAIFTFAYIGKQLYEQIETVDMGAFEAMEAMGGTRFSSFWVAVAPQVLPAYLSTCLFCLEGNVRYAAILGYVGAGGLGMILNEKIGWRDYPSVGMILIVLFATVVVIEALSHYIRSKLT